MYPWTWLWAPMIEFPLSGDVKQDIDTDWFFSGIKRKAGKGKIEKELFNNATYGTQLGIITEVLLSMVENSPIDKEKAKQSTDKLKKIYWEFEAIKKRMANETATDLINRIIELRDSYPEEYARIKASI